MGLQEIKVADEDFPHHLVEDLGYHVYHHGQKGHYGVALLLKQKPVIVNKGFPADQQDAQKRIIMTQLETDFGLLTADQWLFPPGESRHHETKFPAKEKFYADLQALSRILSLQRKSYYHYGGYEYKSHRFRYWYW